MSVETRESPHVDGDVRPTESAAHKRETGSSLMGRRNFMQRLGLGAATVFVVADGVVAYRAWDQGVLTEEKGSAFEALKRWQSYEGPEAAVAAAVLAASAHNTQPWVFAITADRIELYADSSRTTGANDALLREFYVSLGCALENLVLGAHANGFAADVEIAAGAGDLVATVGLASTSPVESELYDAIQLRRSNRSDFTTELVDQASISSMSGLADDGVDLVWIQDTGAMGDFTRLLVEATSAHIADEEQSIASYAWWRNDWDQVQTHKDGLNINGVGLSPLVRSLGRILPGSDRAAADKTFLERTEKQAETAAAFGVLTVADPFSVEAQVRGGRVLERLHLWAAANDLGFQHMNQITERIDRDRQLGNQSQFDGPMADIAGPGTLAAFRIGTPKVSSMKSPRRPVEEVLR